MDFNSGECLKTFDGHSSEIQGLKVLNNDHMLSSCWKEDEVYVWNIASSSEKELYKFQVHQNGVRCFIKTSYGQIISGGEDKIIRIWSYSDDVT